MPAKKEILLDSIKKLLSMDVGEEEIVGNLAAVGVSRPEALTLIKEAKSPKPAQQQPQKKPRFSFFKKKKNPEKPGQGKAVSAPGQPGTAVTKKERATEQLAAQIIERVKEEKQETGEMLRGLGYEEEKEEAPAERETGEKEIAPESGAGETRAEGEPFEETTEEKYPLPESIALGVKKAAPAKKPAAKEEKRKPAIAAKPRAASQAQDVSELWEKGILATVSSNLQEMRQLRKELDGVLDAKIDAATKRELDKIKVLFDSQRALLVSKVDTELQQKANAFAQMIELKLREMRSTAKEIESDIEKIRSDRQKSKGQESDLTARLRELDQEKQRIAAEMNSELAKSKGELQKVLDEANKKLKGMDDRVNKTLQLQSEIAEGLAKDAAVKIEEKLRGSASGLGSRAEAQLDELKASSAALESQIRAKLALVDRKMAELDSFEKNFAKEMGIALDELRSKRK